MRSRSSFLLASTAVLYALNYPLGALALRSMSPFLLITLRFAVTAVVMWAAVAILRSALPRGRAWFHAIGAGLLVQGAQFLGAYWAMSHGVGAGVVALIVAMNPVVVTVLGGLLDRRRDPWRSYVSVGVAALAVVLACLPRILGDPALGAATVTVLVALLGLAGGSVWQGRTLGAVSPVSFTAIGVSASLPLSLLFTTSVEQHFDAAPGTWLLFGVVTLIGLAGTTLYATCVKTVGARQSSLMFAVIPALAALAAWPLLGEPIDPIVVVALVLGGAACVLDVRLARRRRSEASAPLRAGAAPCDAQRVGA